MQATEPVTQRLVAGTDGFGRVLLIDVSSTPPIVVRVWKGYREAQLGWLVPAAVDGRKGSPQPAASLLTMYLPRRGLLEVWPPRGGSRLLAKIVGQGCRLLSTGANVMCGPGQSAKGNDASPKIAGRGCQCFLAGPNGELQLLVVPALAASRRQPSLPVAAGRPAAVANAEEQVHFRCLSLPFTALP